MINDMHDHLIIWTSKRMNKAKMRFLKTKLKIDFLKDKQPK